MLRKVVFNTPLNGVAVFVVSDLVLLAYQRRCRITLPPPQRQFIGVAVAGAVALAGVTEHRAAQWSDLYRLAAVPVRHHPWSPRANYLMGWLDYTRMMGDTRHRDVYFEGARRYFARASLIDGQYAGAARPGKCVKATAMSYTLRNRQ